MSAVRAAAVVLAADASRARLFAAVSSQGELHEIADLGNWANRLHEGDLVADRRGERGSFSGPGRPTEGGHSKWGGDSMKAHRAEEFAAKVCECAARELAETHAERLYIVAEPRFLGLLRQRMDETLRSHVVGEVDKALATHTPAEIRAALPPQL